jgi:hypothetical protein
MSIIKPQALTTLKRLKGSKLVLGGIVIATSAIVGTAGIAAAEQTPKVPFDQNKVLFCKYNYKKLGFKNVGQCISAFNKGHGYGGNGYGGNGDHDHDDHGHHHHGFFGNFENFFEFYKF